MSYRGLVRPFSRASTIARRLPTPGPHGRPLTPTPLSSSRTLSRVSSLSSTVSMSELTRERSRRVRERYQQLEQRTRPQRPVMMSNLRSFSYDMPTQYAEVKQMMRAYSDSPVAALLPSPTPLAESPPPLVEPRASVPRPRQQPVGLDESTQQQGPTQRPEAPEQDLTEQHLPTQQHGPPEEQQRSRQLDNHRQEVLPCGPLSLNQAAL